MPNPVDNIESIKPLLSPVRQLGITFLVNILAELVNEWLSVIIRGLIFTLGLCHFMYVSKLALVAKHCLFLVIKLYILGYLLLADAYTVLYYQLNSRNSIEYSHDQDQPHVQPRFLEHALEQLGLEKVNSS